MTHPAVEARLARLAPDQRAAATAPPGPVLCVAPAGSGKTTTLVARVAWLVDGGADPATIAAITFNKRAAEELGERLNAALGEIGTAPGAVRVATFHALGRGILRSAGQPVEPMADRSAVLQRVAPGAAPADLRMLDTAISKLKLDLAVTADDVATDPDAGPIAQTFVKYERALAADGALDFDDLVIRAIRLLDSSPAELAQWRARCAQLLVDEAQDLDRSQLRLGLLLAAPANRIFLVGDDDQSIYGWRLADVRRILSLDGLLPGLRRVDLVTNYRCPAPVVARAVRLVELNRERFAKRILSGPAATGTLALAPRVTEEPTTLRSLLAAWPADGSTRAVLARTNRELLPAVAAAIELEIPFRAPAIRLLLESPLVGEVLARAAGTPQDLPLLVRLAMVRASAAPGAEAVPAGDGAADAGAADAGAADDDPWTWADACAAVISWAAPFQDLAAFTAAVGDRQARLAALRRDDAALALATAHATKGLEFDHVAVIGLEAGRFPSRRTLDESPEPGRALEEERRLAYVAWTRARRSLTLIYDPDAPSPFLLEAFDADELDRAARAVARTMGS
ncbi:MAG TPA: ATP-dependent helicase [Candidatus Limnocylindrales bacterium]|nr:ATP-dependent helicase [Candidatus Limnocylindrales bacterium]